MIGKRQILPVLIVIAVALSGSRSTADNITGAIVAGGGHSSSPGASVVGALQPTGAVSSRDGPVCFDNGSLNLSYFCRAHLHASSDRRSVDTISHSSAVLKVSCENIGQFLDGRLLFRPGGSRHYYSLPMHRHTVDTLACPLPENLLSSRGLEYYFIIRNLTDYTTIGSQSRPNTMIVGGANREFLCPDSLPNSRYRIIGLPLSVISKGTADDVLRDDLGRYDPNRWRLGRYDATCGYVREFPEIPDFSPGRGFWLIAREGGAFGARGYSVQPNFTWDGERYYKLAVDSGWNQLANPFAFDIDYRELLFVHNGAVLSHEPEIVDDIAYTFTGLGFMAEDILPAWEGFFLFVRKKNVEVLFPYKEALVAIETPVVTKTPAPSPLADNWQLRLTLRVGDLIDAGNTFGVRPDAENGLDSCDHREPPPPPDGPYLAFRPPDIADELYRCDLRTPSPDRHVFPMEMSAHSNRLLTIAGLDILPGNRQLRLLIPGKQPVLIPTDTTLTLPDTITAMRLEVITLDDPPPQEPALPARFHLFQNHPNPFNAATTVRFALPHDGRVTIDVYNVLGQKVTTLRDVFYEAGYHEYHWNAYDSRARALSSGLYLLRLESNNWRGCVKMLLLK